MIETNDYKQQLETELTKITEALSALSIQNPAVPSDWIPRADDTMVGEADENVLADKNEELENRTALVADLETRYNNVKRALAKIANGTYGICEISGEPIESERLAANPAARTCIAHRDDELSLD